MVSCPPLSSNIFDVTDFHLEQLALTETTYTIVWFLQRYDLIENTKPPGPIEYFSTLSTRSGTGVQVKLHEAT